MRDGKHPPDGTGTAADAAAPALISHGQRALAEEYDVALLDLDGTVYNGPVAIGGAVPALAAARKAGLRLAFVTNNSSRSPSAIAAQLSGLGVPAHAADVISSAQAAAGVIARRVPAGSPVLVAGGIGLRLALRARGLRPVSTAAERPVAVTITCTSDPFPGCRPRGVGSVRSALDATNRFGLASVPAKGWFHDLPAGSRIVVAPQAAVGIVAYIATKPQTDPCLTGLPVTIYAREYGTGKSALTENADGTGPYVPQIDVPEGGVGLQIVIFPSSDGSVSSVPDIRLAITMPDGTVRYFKPVLPSSAFQHRMSWRLLGQ